ncbi:MAG: tetratricopeptide repeat protein [Myxococcaceae bacterium]|nr:tetratricopeptide repeat protein [Myxococcaceae bacterium]
MWNLLIALASAVVVAVVVRLLGFPLWAGLVPGLIVFAGAYLALARRTANKVQQIIQAAQKELSSRPNNVREQKAMVEKAVRTLEQGLRYDKWQFLVASELHAQIAMIKYMVKDFDGAQAHFAKANPRNYMARAMQAALYFQKKDPAKMKESFEAAVKAGKKEGMVWAAYAWCLVQLKEKDEAQKVLARAVEANPTDEKLKNALTQLQNDKRLKMKPWEPMWWQLGLEAPSMEYLGGGSGPGGGRRVQFVRR